MYSDGYVFYSSDYNTGCALLKLTDEGGKVTATEVYFSPDMQNHYTTSIKIGDFLYGFSGNQPGILEMQRRESALSTFKIDLLV